MRRTWLQTKNPLKAYDRWLMMGLIGLTMGCIAFLLRQVPFRQFTCRFHKHQLISVLAASRMDATVSYIERGEWSQAWAVWCFMSVSYAGIAAMLVTFIAPAAAASGLPEACGLQIMRS